MKTAGIAAEYNPFHKGHAYQIKTVKEKTGADYVIAVLSGDFVQRGAPAIFDKYQRTRLALLGGADLVLELPVFYACASAEFFAQGAAGILDALNAVDFLCFGSESGDLKTCVEYAKVLLTEPPLYRARLKALLKQGLSFPAARKKALLAVLPESSSPDILDSPNNILGIEYCKALLALRSSISPFTIRRVGAGYHDQELLGTFSSASALRSLLLSRKREDALPALLENVPEESGEYLKTLIRECPPLWEDDFSLPLKYQLMRNTPDSLSCFADLSPELARRIFRRLEEFSSFSKFARLLKTKELTQTRISRALLHALLEILPQDCVSAPSYARILGFKREASPLLRRLQDSSSIPLITKAGDYKRLLDPQAAGLFEKDLFASDLYHSVRSMKKAGESFRSDLKNSPVIL